MLGLICSACSVTRKIPEGQYLLQKVKIDADKSTPRKERITAADFEKYVRQTPNKRFLGTNFYVWLYEQANPGKQNWWNNWNRFRNWNNWWNFWRWFRLNWYNNTPQQLQLVLGIVMIQV